MMPASAAVINHLLRGDAWAGAHLDEHVGKSFRLQLPPFSIALRVSAEGSFEASGKDAGTFDLELTFPLTALPLAFAGRAAVERAVIVKGDAELARSLRELADSMPWVLERELSRWIGPIAAQRIIGLVRGLAAWPDYAGKHLGSSIATYLVEERPTLVKRADFEDTAKSVARLRDDVARLEKRLELAAAGPKSG